MKCCVIQPFYSLDYSASDEMFRKELEMLDACDETMDIIVMPEASDVPALAKTREQYVDSYRKYCPVLLEKCRETAIRCNAMVFVNATYVYPETGKERNTTYCFDRKGNIVGRYYKQHLTPGEVSKRKLDSRYTFEHEEPLVIEMEGIRFGFLTCYDFYFYESFANIARKNIDIIIGCSHQRSDSHQALEIINRFLCYNTNAYLLRASVTLDESSDIGGGSMIVSPKGDVLANLGSAIGMATADIDPHSKYYKPAGFGNPDAAHYEYIEQGRRPCKYRPGGSAMSADDQYMGYPRLCAHRGFGKPENSLPAFGTAVALGADEIEFDLWPTSDGELVSVHDKNLERLSDGTGLVCEKSYAELLKLDFGKGAYKNLKVVTFEEILKKFACHCVMNIHIKVMNNKVTYPKSFYDKIGDLIEKYDCRKYVYFMCGDDYVLKQFQEYLPWATLCVGGGDDPEHIVERAISMGIKKVQLMSAHFDEKKIKLAHDNGIICNLFYADVVVEAKRYLELGIDTILTNNYLELKQELFD